MAKEYIEREHYCKNVCRCAGFENGCSKDKCSLWKVPAADVVEVVRCKDCIHYEAFRDFRSGGYCYCWDFEDGMAPNSVIADDFCSYGKRRTDDG